MSASTFKNTFEINSTDTTQIGLIESNILFTEYKLTSFSNKKEISIDYKHYDKRGGPRQINVKINDKLYQNIKPSWHDDIRANVLYFHNNRVKEKSVKSFVLCEENVVTNDKKTTTDMSKKTIMQFGRIKDRSKFILDFRYPLSPLEAFSITLHLLIVNYEFEKLNNINTLIVNIL